MTDRQQLIVPPLDLVEKWANDFVPRRADAIGRDWEIAFATRAAQWGADQELEACCKWLRTESKTALWQTEALRAARRPKPPSLKEQALEHLEQIHANAYSIGMGFDPSIIRRALEQLND